MAMPTMSVATGAQKRIASVFTAITPSRPRRRSMRGDRARRVAGVALVAGASVAAVAGTGIAGFAVAPRPFRGPDGAHNLGEMELATDLPALLARHLDPNGDGRVPRIESAAIWGRGKMRLGMVSGIPVRMVSIHRTGVAFAADIDVTWWGLPIFHAVDADIGGHGMSRIGSHGIVGSEIDQAGNLFMWCEAILFPSVFAGDSKVVAEAEGKDGVRLSLPLGDGTDMAYMQFEAGHPRRFSALRYREIGKPKIPWRVDYFGWDNRFGITLPERIEATWEDLGRPYFSLNLEGFAANIDSGPRLAEVSKLIAAVREEKATSVSPSGDTTAVPA